MLDDIQLKTIMYALTLKAADCPAAVDEVKALCGQIPERGPLMQDQLNRCGHVALFALWRRLVDGNPEVAEFAGAEWTLYEQRHAMPSLPQQALNLAGSLAGEAVARLKSEPPVLPDEVNRRLALCEACEFFKADEGRCSQCGCYMHVKARFRSAKCSKGKWGHTSEG